MQRQRCKYLALEYGRYCADIVGACNKQYLYEIEVKSSTSDILNDFKKDKHQIYSDINLRNEYVPRLYYFMVSSEIEDMAKAILRGTPYGLLSYYDNPITKISKKVHVAVEPKVINPEKVSNKFLGSLRSYTNRSYANLYREHVACL